MTSALTFKHRQEVLLLGVVCWVILTYIGLYLPQSWLNIFLVVSSWTIGDVVVDRFVIKRRGVIHVPIVHWTITRRSWAVVPYFIGIVIGSTVGDIGGKMFLDILSGLAARAKDAKTVFFFLGSMAIYAMVFFDLRFRVYDPSKQKTPTKLAKQEEPTKAPFPQ